MRSTLTFGDGRQTQQWLSNQAKCSDLLHQRRTKTICQHSWHELIFFGV